MHETLRMSLAVKAAVPTSFLVTAGQHYHVYKETCGGPLESILHRNSTLQDRVPSFAKAMLTGGARLPRHLAVTPPE